MGGSHSPRMVQREPHWHGLPCWQPHGQVEATGDGIWQPQVHAAPTQSVQGQRVVWSFMGEAPKVGGGQGRSGLLCAFWLG